MADDLLALVPMLEVLSCERAIAFYALLGFEVANSSTKNGEVVWALLTGGGASLMVAKYDKLDPTRGQHAVMYIYVADLPMFHARLSSQGVPVKAIEFPEYNPAGEVSLCDENGYLVRLAQRPV
jgi:hypothetical protein